MATALYADWTVRDTAGQSRVISAHTLAYFQRSPCSRKVDEWEVVCRERRVGRTRLQKVGNVGAYQVYEMDYFFEDDQPGTASGLRSVLIQTAPNQIYDVRTDGIPPPPAVLYGTKITRAGSRQLLSFGYEGGGNLRIVETDIALVSPNRLEYLDLQPVVNAAQAVIPAGAHPSGFPHVSFVEMRWEDAVGLGSKAMWQLLGTVRVNFRIEGGSIVVGEATYFSAQ